uniref:Uncharacterized protein n=1 Tax=Colobus angolensis palliatus TaxID=336983 RepID=A0A2K5IKK2_COLAP
MLLLLQEQDKMAPDLSHPEVKNNNIRSSSEGTVAGAGKSGFRLAAFLQLQDGFSKGRMQCHSSKRVR